MNFGLKYVGQNKLESTVITDYFNFGNRYDWEYLIDKLLEETLHTIEDTKYIALYDFDMSFDYTIYLKDFRNLYNSYEEMEIIFRGYSIDNENNVENITIKLLIDIDSIYDYICDDFGLNNYDKNYDTEKYIDILKEAKEYIDDKFEDYHSYESAGLYLDTETYKVYKFDYQEILESEERIKEFNKYKAIMLFGNKTTDYHEAKEFFGLLAKKLNSLQDTETSNTELIAEENNDLNSTNTEEIIGFDEAIGLLENLNFDKPKKEDIEPKKTVNITEDDKINAVKSLDSIAHLFQLGNDKKEPKRNAPEEIKKTVNITEDDKINADKKLASIAHLFQLGNDKKEKEVKKELTPQEVIKSILGNQKLKMANNKEYKDMIFKIMARVNNYDKEKVFKKLFKLKTNNEIKTQYFVSQTPERTIIFTVDRFIVINNTTKKYMLSNPMTNKRDFIEDFIKYLPITSEEKKYFYTVLKKSYLFYKE